MIRTSPYLRIGFGATIACASLFGQAPDAVWTLLQSSGDLPSVRRGVQGIYDEYEQRFIMHGGESPDFQFFPDTHFFDPTSGEWIEPNISNPNPRCHHTFLNDSARNRGLVFGGFPRNNELWSFDLVTDQWQRLFPDSPLPAPRCLHASVICSGREEMIVYGGLKGLQAVPDLEDTWSFDLKTDTWSLVESSSAPGMRFGSIAVLDSKQDRIVLFGGLVRQSINQLQEENDLWAFDLNARSWEPLNAINPGPTPRQFSRGFTYRGGMLLFGGRNQFNRSTGEQEFKNDLWYLDFATLRWTRIETGGPSPPPRFRHTVLKFEQDQMLIGMGEGANGIHYNDIWLLRLANPPGDLQSLKLQISKAGSASLRITPPLIQTFIPVSESTLPITLLKSPNLTQWSIHSTLPSDAIEPVHLSIDTPSSNTYYRIKTNTD